MQFCQQLARVFVCSSLLIGVAAEAHAQGKGKAAARALDVAKIKASLESGDEAKIKSALSEVEQAGAAGKPAIVHVEALLRRGASVTGVTRAMDVCAGAGQPSSSAVIAPYLRHRVPEVRRGAARALSQTKGPNAVTALKRALRSADPQVRGVAASGLGSLNAKEALPDLFKAFSLKVGEAAASIGQLCSPEECEKFAALLGKHPFDVMTSGFDQILFRPAAEMPDDQKIRVVGRLRELGTRDAGNYLADVAERWPAGSSKRVKQALDGAVKALGGSASSGEDE